MLSEKGHKLGATTKRVISTLIVQKTGQFLCFSKMFFPDFLSAITEFNIQWKGEVITERLIWSNNFLLQRVNDAKRDKWTNKYNYLL